jgi:hypothetical protein
VKKLLAILGVSLAATTFTFAEESQNTTTQEEQEVCQDTTDKEETEKENK